MHKNTYGNVKPEMPGKRLRRIQYLVSYSHGYLTRIRRGKKTSTNQERKIVTFKNIKNKSMSRKLMTATMRFVPN